MPQMNKGGKFIFGKSLIRDDLTIHLPTQALTEYNATAEGKVYLFTGKISCMITYGEANDPAYIPLLKENQKDYIYHSELVLENQRIIMSDHVDIEFQTCYSNFLTIMYDTKEEVQRAYEIMKEGSKTIYQLEATPYSSCRVVFVDRFGIRWGIMTEQTER